MDTWWTGSGVITKSGNMDIDTHLKKRLHEDKDKMEVVPLQTKDGYRWPADGQWLGEGLGADSPHSLSMLDSGVEQVSIVEAAQLV